jgi:translocation and assembly module TamA
MVVAFVLMMSFHAAKAADPQPYTVAIAPTGNATLDTALQNASQLDALREKAPVGPFALVSRAKQDLDRFATVMQSFGYYQGKVGIDIDGHPLDDPELPERLDDVPKDKSVTVTVTPEPGPLYHLRRITLDGTVPPDAAGKLGLSAGQPAIASDVLAAGARLLTALQEDGYALAKVDPPLATEIPAEQALDVSFTADPGARATIGTIALDGLGTVNESFVRRRLKLHSGELYQPSKIEAARQDLAAIGVFSGVSARAGDRIAPDGTIPITFDVQERAKRTVGITGAYSTDLGASAKLSWSHRNLFGNAEQLNLSAAATGLGGTATRSPGYDLSAQLIKPDFLRPDQALEFNLGAIKQSLQAYDQTAETAGTVLRRKFSPLWSGSVGLTAEQEQITQESVTNDYTLVGVPLTANYDSTGLADPLQDPTRGIRAAFTATPTHSFAGRDITFLILQVSGSTYFDLATLGLADPGRSVVAVRGLAGAVQGASQFDLPPDQRFYGGGSGTVRGFKYQSIGPSFADGNPAGGTAIDAGSIEFRQRLFGDFGGVAFLDAGQVSTSHFPFTGRLRVGTGVGVRYYTPIGPIRLDVAVPVNAPPHSDRFELYIGLGQAF